MTGRERLAALAIMAFVAVAAILAMALINRQPAEDDPGWDCRTMGNHQCGPTTPPCQGDTVAAPCGTSNDWTTGKGD